MHLVPVNKISITLLVDNVTDLLLASTPHAQRPPVGKDGKFLPVPIAEHGFSVLIEAEADNPKDGSVQRNATYHTFANWLVYSYSCTTQLGLTITK
jgi:hypothetical protein